jgi:hypothetical protein
MKLTRKRRDRIAYQLFRLVVFEEVREVAQRRRVTSESVRFTERQLLDKAAGIANHNLGISRDEYIAFIRKVAADVGYPNLYPAKFSSPFRERIEGDSLSPAKGR